MINILKKIEILKYINKNKDKIKYKFHYDVADFTEFNTAEIYDKNLVSISMHRNMNNDNTIFCLEYNMHDDKKSSYRIIRPWEQSFFDTMFISKMYYKMLAEYTKQHGKQDNSHTR